jgi:hypothetical protein
MFRMSQMTSSAFARATLALLLAAACVGTPLRARAEPQNTPSPPAGAGFATGPVAFLTPVEKGDEVLNPAERTLVQRVRDHFADDDLVVLPVSSFLYTDSATVSSFCESEHVNAIVVPFFGITMSLSEYGNAAVSGNLTIVDCAGIPYYVGRRDKQEPRRGASRDLVREAVSMGDDVADQLLAAFDAYRRQHEAAWTSLVQHGVAADPNAPIPALLVGVNIVDHRYRIMFLRSEGRGAKAGLQRGDVIATINGAPVPPGTTGFGVMQMLEIASTVGVVRQGGPQTVTLKQ